MPELSDYLLNAAIAALLGAGTNELAIVAILRYILPRKKNEIARRIQSLVSTDLLSPEKMRAKLDDQVVGDVMEKNLDQALEAFFSRDLPSPNALLAGHLAEANALAGRLQSTLLDEFSRRVTEASFQDEVLRPFLASRWQALAQRTPRSFLSRPDAIPPALAEWVCSLEDSQPLRDSVTRAVDRFLAGRLASARCPQDLLTPGLVQAAEDIIVREAPAIIQELADILRQPPVRDTIAQAIMQAIRGELRGQGVLGNVKGAFVNVMGIRRDIDGICRRLPDSLEASFKEPHRRHAFVALLRAAVLRALSRDLDDDFRSPEKRAAFVRMVVEALWQRPLFTSLSEKISEVTNGALSQSLKDTLDRLGPGDNPGAIVQELTARAQRILASDSTRDLLAAQLDSAIQTWRSQPLGRLDRFIDPETRCRLARTITREGRELLRERLADFAEEAGMWDIITASIEGYDERQLTALIQNLARSELRWVTILGGIVGAAVGLFQTFLQHSL